MVILEDSRQQAGKHELKHATFKAEGDEVIRSKIVFGDYCLPPAVAVDTKANMAEIAQNIGGTREEHNRFRRECQAAAAAGCRLIVLVENDEGIRTVEDVKSWRNPRAEYSAKAIDGPRLSRAMQTMAERYGVTFMFCSPEEAAHRIKDILKGGGNAKEKQRTLPSR